MNEKLRNKLLSIAKKRVKNDISHDFGHIYRVLKMAEKIAIAEGGDLDVIIPASLFHDIIVHKGTSRYKYEHEESALFARDTLRTIREFPKDKIDRVVYAISVCSFSKNIKARTLEAKILQDADLLEATGAVSIMRTFASSMVMHVRSFYDPDDPFCRDRIPNDRLYSLDLFFTRLMKVKKRMNTKTAKSIETRRNRFLKEFIDELKEELKDLN